MTNESALRRFGAAIQHLLGRGDLERTRCRDLFREVLAGQQHDLHQGAFLAALVAKGETAAEIAGAWEAIDSDDTVHPDGLPADLLDNSGTGMDPVKTFNISTCAALVAAAAGVRLARHGARALTSRCGTVDLCEALGVGVEVAPETVAASIRTCGIGLFNGMSAQVHPGALFRILAQIRFGSTLNIAASLANPARPTLALRGVYHPRLVPLVAEVLPLVGIRRAWVVHGLGADGTPAHDELSITGESLVCAIDGASSRSFRIRPEEVGLRRWSADEVAPAADREAAAEDARAILGGRGRPARNDAVALNAGAILVVAGACPDLATGVAQVQRLLAAGAGLELLQRWIACQAPARQQPHGAAHV